MQRLFASLIAVCLGFAIMGLAPNAAYAAQQSAPILTLKELERQLSPVKKASYRHYCVRQYFKCRDRWGGGWRFRRCMKWRGCWEAYLDYRERANITAVAGAGSRLALKIGATAIMIIMAA